jgi:hypothetical protein
MGPKACYGGSFTFLYVDDVRTSQEAHLWAPTADYGDSFTFSYVDDVRTSQEARLWALTACYGDSFTFLYRRCSYLTRSTPMGPHGLLRR